MHRILIIDDEDDIREVAALSLETVAGWEVMVASSGAQGLARAADVSAGCHPAGCDDAGNGWACDVSRIAEESSDSAYPGDAPDSEGTGYGSIAVRGSGGEGSFGEAFRPDGAFAASWRRFWAGARNRWVILQHRSFPRR